MQLRDQSEDRPQAGLIVFAVQASADQPARFGAMTTSGHVILPPTRNASPVVDWAINVENMWEQNQARKRSMLSI
jgi:hypothetical protein